MLIPLGENTWVIQGGANIGIIAYGGRCLIIDSGLDKDAGRDILKQLKKLMLKEGTFQEMKRRAHYEKPSVKRKRKAAAARKKRRRALARSRDWDRD